jgi:hypothetical protein
MSAPVSGKFQDHYAILGVDPKAALEAIQIAHERLAQRYHPDTPQTGDKVKFESIELAYEVLSDPVLRLSFDQVKGIDQDDAILTFAGLEFFEALGRQSGLRAAMLCVLYDRRRKKPSKPSLSIRHIDSMIQATHDELNFALFYLKQKGLVIGDDKSNMMITVDGMDYLEHEQPAPEKVFPFIKAGALLVPATPAPAAASVLALAKAVQPSAPTPPPTGVVAEAESVLKVLTRALARR